MFVELAGSVQTTENAPMRPIDSGKPCVKLLDGISDLAAFAPRFWDGPCNPMARGLLIEWDDVENMVESGSFGDSLEYTP